MIAKLSESEKKELLGIARASIEAIVIRKQLDIIEIDTLSKNLKTKGASFVTLTIKDRLRGCIGTMEAYQPLALDVQEHAAAAAIDDYRFEPVTKDEIPLLKIEISHLSPLVPLEYKNSLDLLNKLRPGVDGVLIKDGSRRATFLPQVWKKSLDSEEFLSHLCIKMGASPDLWQKNHLSVYTYQVNEFKED